MTSTDLTAWEPTFERFLKEQPAAPDPAHDPAHVQRVVATARRLAAAEGARLAVVVPAAWLHDCVAVRKDDPARRRASVLAAEAAGRFLRQSDYPEVFIPLVEHAIEAHSYSAGVAPETPEAAVVQDADRLDALGAVGIARAFMVGGALGLALCDGEEPFPRQRPVDDRRYVVDHFYAKLLGLAATMQTAAGKAEAERRTAFMQTYLKQLGEELAAKDEV